MARGGPVKTVEVLTSALPAGRVTTAEADRRAHAHDYWALEAIHDRGPEPAQGPACVVFPESTAEVATVLEIADRLRTPVVPFGLGSGVCGGVLPGHDSIVVDLTRMASLVSASRESLVAVAQAGMNGAECERQLGESGLTLGHFPQSIARSTVGGWVATRASGQLSTRYGNIEDLVLALEVVLPGGQIVRTFPSPRAATGPDLRALFLGSEGTLGIVTEVTLKLSPTPAFQQGFAARLKTWDDGLAISREMLQAGWRPAVLRLYDEIEAARNFTEWVPQPSALLLVLSEGSQAMGDFYQISNQITLGRSEPDLIKQVGDVVPVIIDYERKARDVLIKEGQQNLHDRVSRAYGILRNAQTISSEETMRLAQSAEKRIFAPGEMVIRAGDPGVAPFAERRRDMAVEVGVGEPGEPVASGVGREIAQQNRVVDHRDIVVEQRVVGPGRDVVELGGELRRRAGLQAHRLGHRRGDLACARDPLPWVVDPRGLGSQDSPDDRAQRATRQGVVADERDPVG